MSFKRFSEVPNQNFSLIKRNVQSNCRHGKRLSDADLFVDPSFPPDLTSLTYVYTGDDRYEKMVFKRPLSFENDATFCGIGGAWDAPYPWKTFKKRDWFQAAVIVVSLGVRYLEKIIPGYRNCEQNFINEYIGAFRFNIWRFGEWQETIVDDNLPCLQTTLLYCQAYGSPPEFWGPLLEKAYAKIMKTYESIEVGNTLNALCDLTGDICEFYTQDTNPPANLFYIMYKSYLNRSLVVCWRNQKRLTHTGFHHTLESIECNSFEDDNEDKTRYLHIVTAIAKFPTTDGRLIEMVRLRCPFTTEPNWHGKFSSGDQISWGSVSLWFLERYKPLASKDNDEYWMTYEDFRCNFGGLIITSGTDPFRPQGFSIKRRKSAPLIGRNFSSSSLSHLTHSSFLATKTDNFRSRGGWKLLVEHRNRWTKHDVLNLSMCPRVHFSISKQDVLNNEMVPQNCRGKSHVLISLLQDYRRGPTIKNSQLVPIGMCLYKCKQAECKDLSKYKCIGQIDSREEEREITARFDLEEGNYVLLPYSTVSQHEGEFLVRVLGEKDMLCGTRNGCILS